MGAKNAFDLDEFLSKFYDEIMKSGLRWLRWTIPDLVWTHFHFQKWFLTKNFSKSTRFWLQKTQNFRDFLKKLEKSDSINFFDEPRFKMSKRDVLRLFFFKNYIRLLKCRKFHFYECFTLFFLTPGNRQTLCSKSLQNGEMQLFLKFDFTAEQY